MKKSSVTESGDGIKRCSKPSSRVLASTISSRNKARLPIPTSSATKQQQVTGCKPTETRLPGGVNNAASSEARRASRLIKDGESNSGFKVLPSDIKLDIISRLPFDSVLDCKLVCKSWCQAIRNPDFAKIHLRQQLDSGGDEVSFIFFKKEEKIRLCYRKFDKKSRKKLATVNHCFIEELHLRADKLVGSCNGLVCFCACRYLIDDPLYICNPNLGEYMILPRFTVMAANNVEVKRTFGYIVSGFGYNSIIDEYKVVRIYCDDRPLNIPQSQVQVYTLGSGSGWRNLGECPYSLIHTVYSGNFLARGILADGALHWLDKDMNIVAFDLVNEVFSLFLSPPCFCPGGSANFYALLVLGGCLCVVNDRNFNGKETNIWSFKKETNEWQKMFGISYQSMSISRFIDLCWPISLPLSSKLILRFYNGTLVCYDPQTKQWKSLKNCNTISFISPVPHLNSFVSLKTLGEM